MNVKKTNSNEGPPIRNQNDQRSDSSLYGAGSGPPKRNRNAQRSGSQKSMASLGRQRYGILLSLTLLASAFVFAKFQGGFVSWFLFYAFLPISLYTLCYGWLALKGMRVERRVEKTTCTAGEGLQVELIVHNPYRFPLVYCTVQDMLPKHLRAKVVPRYLIAYPWFKKEWRLTYELQHVPRGEFSWRHIQLESGDLFGFIRKKERFEQPEQLLVYPAYQELRRWQTQKEKNVGVNDTLNRKFAEDITSVMGTRDYAPGDRLTRIHWKASAKAGMLKTKEFEHQVTNDFMFFLDCDQKRYEGRAALFEKSVSLTASLARFALKKHYSCGLVSYGRKRTVLPISREQEHLYRVFDHLARVQPDGTFSFMKAVLREAVYLPQGTTIVLLSPQLSERMVTMISELKQRQKKVEFFWLGDGNVDGEMRYRLQQLAEQQVPSYPVTVDDFNRLLSLGGHDHVSA